MFFQKPKFYNITASREHHYTWFRIAKNGTRTFLEVLKEKTNPEVDGFVIKYTQWKHWNRFKFCMIRNPYDRLVSCYTNKVLGKVLFPECWDKDFAFFVNYVAAQDLKTSNIHFRLQTELFPVKGVDYIGRFENFEKEFDYILNERLQLDAELVFNNTSDRKHYREYYTEKEKAIVEQLYRRDLEFGDYVY